MPNQSMFISINKVCFHLSENVGYRLSFDFEVIALPADAEYTFSQQLVQHFLMHFFTIIRKFIRTCWIAFVVKIFNRLRPSYD